MARRNILSFAILACAVLALIAVHSLCVAQAVKAVYRKGNELFTIGADGEPQQFTNDGVPKGNPLWA